MQMSIVWSKLEYYLLIKQNISNWVILDNSNKYVRCDFLEVLLQLLIINTC